MIKERQVVEEINDYGRINTEEFMHGPESKFHEIVPEYKDGDFIDILEED